MYDVLWESVDATLLTCRRKNIHSFGQASHQQRVAHNDQWNASSRWTYTCACSSQTPKRMKGIETILQDTPNHLESTVHDTRVSPRPLLLLVGGLMGTGKSTLAHALQQQLGCPLFSSDIIRKDLVQLRLNIHPMEPFEGGIYSPIWTQKTYEALCQRAHECLQQGQSVILDATFSCRANRQMITRTALTSDANVIFIECVCPRELAIERLSRRWSKRSHGEKPYEASNASDGRPDLFDPQATRWESFEPALEPHMTHIVLSTTDPLQEMLRTLVDTLQRHGASS